MSRTTWAPDDTYEASFHNEEPARLEHVTEISERDADGERGLTVCYSVADGENLKTLMWAPKMRADIQNFCAAVYDCQSQAEAAKIAKDFYALFKQYI